VLAVTTRNRLRGPRFCFPMLRARALIARQLARQAGLVRYASGVVSPTEFLTLSIWESRQAMQRFMQSGEHERYMWLFSRWTASFWGMRWEPTLDEVGAWSGLRLAQNEAAALPRSPLVATGLLPAETLRAGPLGPRPEGTAVEPRGSGLVATTGVFGGPAGLLRARRAAARLRSARADADLVRWSVGLDLPPRGLAISVWHDAPEVRRYAVALLDADWAMCWQPAEYEIGHWDGLRLRQAARLRR
jgi:antibiotic biosynthesis monooxygenase